MTTETTTYFGGFWAQKVEALPGEQVMFSGNCAHGYRLPWLVNGELHLTNKRLIWSTVKQFGALFRAAKPVTIPSEDVLQIEPVDHRWALRTWRNAWIVKTTAEDHFFSTDVLQFWGVREEWIRTMREWANI